MIWVGLGYVGLWLGSLRPVLVLVDFELFWVELGLVEFELFWVELGLVEFELFWVELEFELFWVKLGLGASCGLKCGLGTRSLEEMLEFELFWVKLGLGASCGLKCGLGTRSLEEILRLLVEVVTVRFIFVGLCLQTKDWWLHMFCTILGIIEVDVFSSFNVHTKQPPHSVFTENLVIACLTNRRPGAPAAKKHITELRKRRRQDDEEDTVYQNDVQQIEHEAMPITKHFETRRVQDRLTMQKKQKMSKHGTAVRCNCCSQCLDENDGNIFGLCGPKSGRVCIPIHQKSMWSSP